MGSQTYSSDFGRDRYVIALFWTAGGCGDGDPVAGGQIITLDAPALGSEVGWAATLVRMD